MKRHIKPFAFIIIVLFINSAAIAQVLTDFRLPASNVFYTYTDYHFDYVEFRDSLNVHVPIKIETAGVVKAAILKNDFFQRPVVDFVFNATEPGPGTIKVISDSAVRTEQIYFVPHPYLGRVLLNGFSIPISNIDVETFLNKPASIQLKSLFDNDSLLYPMNMLLQYHVSGSEEIYQDIEVSNEKQYKQAIEKMRSDNIDEIKVGFYLFRTKVLGVVSLPYSFILKAKQ